MSRTQKVLVTVVFAVLVLALFAVLAYGLANRSSATGRSGMTRIGKPAPQFAMQLLDGGEFQLSDHEGDATATLESSSLALTSRMTSLTPRRTFASLG